MNSGKVLWLIPLAFCALSLIPISCNETSPAISDSNQALIYASVIRKMYVIDYSPGAVIAYIMRYTDDNAGTQSPKLNSILLKESLQKAILNNLAGINEAFIWVDQSNEISDDVLSGRGCEIILGNIYSQTDGSVHVTASLFFGGTGGGGTTYILKLINDVWTVTGRTGASWIS